ncbi:MAG TPA: 4-alpha-glucanotransferase [Gaiellaceae bacterium]|nr:4-alpha-glucanotransferase [Gaiellaceae bacterium]
MELPRSAGVLLHPTSLPSGRLDGEAYRFVDWLAAAGQSWWQVLPLGPPDELGSPYRPASVFAGSPGLLARPRAPVSAGEVEDFVARHPYWAGVWARFAGAGALADQVRFEREWRALRAYAAERGVRLIGDLPIYVSEAGADLAGWPELFARGEVAGAPPDALSAVGQRWGNPLYDWAVHRATGYRWWRERFRRAFELVDLCRVDHFRGFVAYWAVPERNRTARRGRWRPGPGARLFRAVERDLGGLPLIAEDLGRITPAVYRLRDELGLPGMAVLLWAFGGSRSNPHRPENHREHTVVYTSTHDTDTAVGWFRSLPLRQRARTGLDPDEPHWGLVELAYASPARLAVVPAQDLLGLGSEARMNRPGVARGNWRWRLERGTLTGALAERLRALAERHGRAAAPAGLSRPDGRRR